MTLLQVGTGPIGPRGPQSKMMQDVSAWLLRQLKAAKPSFISKTPHFNFISAHYFWIVGMTILASVLIFATGHGELAYIDALFLASGANTQAGLNTVDVNLLNTFQQVALYVFAMTSNPITIHSTVVFLRLYWFEKRFQGVVREARSRRGTLSKSKVRANDDPAQVEKGVNGRHITVMHGSANASRMTNDGILLSPILEANGHAPESPRNGTVGDKVQNGARRNSEAALQAPGSPIQITFAGTVKRSDGMEEDLTKLPPRRSDAEHIAILERQRNVHGDEVLRIPNPRDAERGMKPKRLEEGDAPEAEEEAVPNGRSTAAETSSPGSPSSGPVHRGRQQTIVIEEPDRRRKETERGMLDELADEATAIGNTFAPLKFRKPRLFNSRNKTHHVEDSDSEDNAPTRTRSRTFETIRGALTREKIEDTPYLSWTPTMGRNSQFPGLTLEQREELGGIEYRSLRTLALLLVCYFWGFSLLILACLLPWIMSSSNVKYANIVESAGVTKTWWGFFTANSAFMDLGYTLTPDSMNSFQDVPFVLMTMWFLIIVGNTGFPVMLRVIIWILAQIIPRGTGLWEELRFLLDHPRRCFTLLFPSGATWWLFWILVGLNIADLLFFVLLDLNDNAVSSFPVNIRIVNGLFQAASTRTAGFSCVNLALLHPAVQVSYMIMMYISVFPIAISIRRTNVYEEKSLGVYKTPEEEEAANENSALSYVGTHLRRQLSFDLWYVFVGLFILGISEGSKIKAKEFDMFAVLFEIVSAYGTVGMSLGYPGVNASLCSQFSVVGKLVIVAMMIRGRHRGLPYGLDRAILLPSETRFETEAEEAHPVLARSATAATSATATGARRASFSTSGRGRSRSGERSNTNIIASLLHPGPVVPHHHHHPTPARERMFDHHLSVPSQDMAIRRRNTEPVDDDSDDDDDDEPRTRARRIATTPMG